MNRPHTNQSSSAKLEAESSVSVNLESASAPVKATQAAFTLIELMVVMLIIGVLAGIAVPAMKGLGQANRSAAVHSQILADLSMARLRAINDRAPVYMVFVPTNIAQAFNRPSSIANTREGRAERMQLTNLLGSQYAAYALVAGRSVGDQPGRPTPRYITEWRTLPEGSLFAPYKFLANAPNAANEYVRTFATNAAAPLLALPFPNSTSQKFALPCIAFNSQGQLVSQRDEVIALAKGSVFTARDPAGRILLNSRADVQLNPPVQANRSPVTQTNTYRFVRISWLTGRAKVELPEFRQ